MRTLDKDGVTNQHEYHNYDECYSPPGADFMRYPGLCGGEGDAGEEDGEKLGEPTNWWPKLLAVVDLMISLL